MNYTSIVTQRNGMKTFLINVDHSLESDLAITNVFSHVARTYYQISIKDDPQAKRDQFTWHDFAEVLYFKDGVKCLFKPFAVHGLRVIPLSCHIMEPTPA